MHRAFAAIAVKADTLSKASDVSFHRNIKLSVVK
jgi:hypothetical protein